MSFSIGKSWRDFLHRTTGAVLLLAFTLGNATWAAAPSWWSSQGILQSGATQDDYGLLNQGQLKNLATAAAAEMNAIFPDGAGTAINYMVLAWDTDTTEADDYSLGNVGQLKAVAAPFYDRMTGLGLVSGRPWTAATTDDDDYAPANLGQAKYLFSFPVVSPFEHIMSDPLWATLENILDGSYVGVLSQQDYASLQNLIARLTNPALIAALNAELAKTNPAPAAQEVNPVLGQAQTPGGQTNVVNASPVAPISFERRQKGYIYSKRTITQIDPPGTPWPVFDGNAFYTTHWGENIPIPPTVSSSEEGPHLETLMGIYENAIFREIVPPSLPLGPYPPVIDITGNGFELIRYQEKFPLQIENYDYDWHVGGAYGGSAELRAVEDSHGVTGPVIPVETRPYVIAVKEIGLAYGQRLVTNQVPPSTASWPLVANGTLFFTKKSNGSTDISTSGTLPPGMVVISSSGDAQSNSQSVRFNTRVAAPSGGGEYATWGCSVGVHPIQFTVVPGSWKAIFTEPIINHFPPGGIQWVNLGVLPDGNSAKLEAKVKIHIPGLPAAEANSVAQEWDLYFFQNIVRQGATEARYEIGDPLKFMKAPVPGQDTNGGGSDEGKIPKIKSFSQNEQELAISLEDTPSLIGLPRWKHGNPGTNNPLTGASYNAEFVTWLFAQHRATGKRVYLKWIRWEIALEADFDFTKNPPDTKKTWRVRKLDEGGGQGSVFPVETHSELIQQEP